MKANAFPSLLLLFALAACSVRSVSNRLTIKYVEDIIASKSGYEISLLKRSGEPRPISDLVIIGEDELTGKLASRFERYDIHDNVSGRLEIDDLPDFAGETFTCITYPHGEELSREKTVKMVLAALDTVAHISPYDLDGMASKAPAKVIMLADPLLAGEGAFDVDTLFRSTLCHVPVYSPVDMLLDKLFTEAAGKTISVGFLVDSLHAASGVYFELFKNKATQYSAYGSTCVTTPSDSREDLIRKMLDMYVVGGNSRPLDAVIVDDIDVDIEELKLELAGIVSVMNESSMTYGKLLSGHFEVLDTFGQLAQTCYSYLRENNLFTHNISKPQVSVYRPVSSPDSSDGTIILVPASYVQ